jgi:hypothetical protein
MAAEVLRVFIFLNSILGFGTANIRAIEVKQQTKEFKTFHSYVIEKFTLGLSLCSRAWTSLLTI